MKKILGLDLGSSSIGWAFIHESESKSAIVKLGVRVVPLSSDESDKFIKGQAITVNKDRTLKRTARKTNHRYKLRRLKLSSLLAVHGLMPNASLLKNTDSLVLYGFRSKAVTEKIQLDELGRVLLHLNQKRGYKSSRNESSEGDEKALSDYLTEIKERKEELENRRQTIGQFFYEELLKNRYYTIKKKVFPRECYLQEFDSIWRTQAKFYPDILTEQLRTEIRDNTIFYQRRLKSQKHLVGKCTLEPNSKVAPKSSPLFQLDKIWESVNTISLQNKFNDVFPLTQDHRIAIAEYLDNNEKLSSTALFKIIGVKATSGWYPNEQIKKAGIQGNTTKAMIRKAFAKLGIERSDLLQFNLSISEAVDTNTGEMLGYSVVDDKVEFEPLYQFWHLLYSVESPSELLKVLIEKYGFSKDQAEVLSKIDFKKLGYGNKSSKAIRKILPGLMEGANYAYAAAKARYNHSNSMTKEDNLSRELADELQLYPKNSLRQPIVEKVLNQLINVINEIIRHPEMGRPDEIRIELARELKQSKDERNEAYSNNIRANKYHQELTNRLASEYPGLKVTRKVIEKYKLFEKQDGICMYTGKKMELAMVLRGETVDVDHIIPQSKLFDDSFQNKVLAFRIENAAKGSKTAYDYMKSKSEEEYGAFVERIGMLLESGKITRSKWAKLMTTEADIPDNFINRQMNETRFISREATKLLSKVCRNVFTTTGSVTDFLREEWGYNEVLKQLNYEKYEKIGKVQDGKIVDWSKRDDHRHHAVDALVVACTKQRIIQYLNTLHSRQTVLEIEEALKNKESARQKNKRLINAYIETNAPFPVETVKRGVDSILISIKPGKKVASPSFNKATGKRILIPRGQLHKESVYGKIKKYSATKTPLNGRFSAVDRIANANEKKCVKDRLEEFGNDPKKAFKDLDKYPIWIDEAKTKRLTEVTLWEEEFVIKYELGVGFKEKDIPFIVDVKLREKVKQRFEEKAGQKEHPLKDLANNPIWQDENKTIPIKSVRCFTGLKELVPLHKSTNGITSSYTNGGEGQEVDFVSTRNNHHLGIYRNPDGTYFDIAVSFWEALERKRHGLPYIVKDPKQAWDIVINSSIENRNVLELLPKDDSMFLYALTQNDYYVMGIGSEEFDELISRGNYALLSKALYRVQKLSKKASGSIEVFFRHHLETSVDDKSIGENNAKISGKLINISSVKSLLSFNPIHVGVNKLGEMRRILE